MSDKTSFRITPPAPTSSLTMPYDNRAVTETGTRGVTRSSSPMGYVTARPASKIAARYRDLIASFEAELRKRPDLQSLQHDHRRPRNITGPQASDGRTVC